MRLDLDGVSSLAYTFRFDLLDADLVTVDTVEPDRLHQPPQISYDQSDRMPRTLRNLNVPPGFADAVDVIAARVQPFMVLADGTEYPLGVFLFSDAQRPTSTAGTRLVGTLADQTLVLDSGIEEAVGWWAGERYSDAMRQVLDRYPLPGGFDVDVSDATFAEATSYRPGSSGATILRELAEKAGYLPPCFDSTGRGHLEAVPILDNDTEADHVYDLGGRIVKGSIMVGNDLLTAPNVIVAVSRSASGSDVSGSFVLPQAAPNSVSHRGFRVPRFVDVSGVGSTAGAENAAEAAAHASPLAFETVEYETAIDPRHDCNHTTEVVGVVYLETAFQFTCQAGATMSHQGSRAVYL